MRQGAHQVAHKSTSAGTDAFSTTRSKSRSPAEVIHGNHWWQLPQRGFPSAPAGTRFRFPQCGHLTVVGCTPALASGRDDRFRVANGEFTALDVDPNSSPGRDVAAE